MTKDKQKTQKSVSRNSAGMMDAIFDEWDALRSGASNPAQANATAKLAGTILETVRLEMDVQKHMEKAAQAVNASGQRKLTPVALGGES